MDKFRLASMVFRVMDKRVNANDTIKRSMYDRQLTRLLVIWGNNFPSEQL